MSDLRLPTVLTLFAAVAGCLAAPAVAAPGRDASPPAAVRDLAAASLKAASAGTPVWNSQARVTAHAGRAPEIVPPATIIPGRFASARFRGQQTSWVGFDTLVLDVRSRGEGQLVIVLMEYDGGIHEDYTLRVDSIPSGNSTLRFRLAPVPEGDLVPSPLKRDGEWNPDDADGVTMILADYPPGFAIEGMRLEMSQK